MYVWRFVVQASWGRKPCYCVADSEHNAKELAVARHVDSARTEILNLVRFRRAEECSPELLARLSEQDARAWRQYMIDSSLKRELSEIERFHAIQEREEMKQESIVQQLLKEQQPEQGE